MNRPVPFLISVPLLEERCKVTGSRHRSNLWQPIRTTHNIIVKKGYNYMNLTWSNLGEVIPTTRNVIRMTMIVTISILISRYPWWRLCRKHDWEVLNRKMIWYINCMGRLQASNWTVLSMISRLIFDRLNWEKCIGFIYVTDIYITSGPEADRLVLKLNVCFPALYRFRVWSSDTSILK